MNTGVLVARVLLVAAVSSMEASDSDELDDLIAWREKAMEQFRRQTRDGGMLAPMLRETDVDPSDILGLVDSLLAETFALLERNG